MASHLAPYAHVDPAEVTARRARRPSTVYQQLLAQGFTPDDIAAEVEVTVGIRRIALLAARQDGTDEPMLGVAYGGDFRSEEEAGIPQIGRSLRELLHDDHLFTGEVEGHWYLGIHADSGAWREGENVPARATEALRRAREEQQDAPSRDRWLRVADLRKNLRDVGVTGPLPRTKDELLALHAEHVHGRWDIASVGEFHHGDTLILLPGRPVITAVLRILAAAGTHLRMTGPTSGPFRDGAVLIDERDWTAEHVEKIRAAAARRERLDAEAEPVRKLLRKNGRLWSLRAGDTMDRAYWLNYSPRNARQVSGWFSLDELERRAREEDWDFAR